MPARKPSSWGTIRCGVLLEVVASVVELRRGRAGQSLARLIENRRRERRVSHGPHDPCGFGAEVLLKSALESRKQFGDRSGGAGRVRDLARKHELAAGREVSLGDKDPRHFALANARDSASRS